MIAQTVVDLLKEQDKKRVEAQKEEERKIQLNQEKEKESHRKREEKKRKEEKQKLVESQMDLHAKPEDSKFFGQSDYKHYDCLYASVKGNDLLELRATREGYPFRFFSYLFILFSQNISTINIIL